MGDELSERDQAAIKKMGEAWAEAELPTSLRMIAKLTGVSPATTLRDLRAANPNYDGDQDGNIEVRMVRGLDGKIRPSRRVDTTARDEAIRQLRDEGKTQRAIAAEVGCSVGTVARILKG